MQLEQFLRARLPYFPYPYFLLSHSLSLSSFFLLFFCVIRLKVWILFNPALRLRGRRVLGGSKNLGEPCAPNASCNLFGGRGASMGRDREMNFFPSISISLRDPGGKLAFVYLLRSYLPVASCFVGRVFSCCCV